MPINKEATLVSSTGAANTWYSTLSRADAVAGAILKTTSATRNVVQNIGQQFPFWPTLDYYAAQTGEPTPQYVWDDNAPAGPETRYFAHAFELDFPAAGVALTRLATADVFSDNAHTLFIEEYLNITLPPIPPLQLGINLINSITPAPSGAQDGSLSSAGQASAPPFGWQTISKFSEPYLATLPVGLPLFTDYFFVVSFEVANYVPNGTTNPAGLQYIVELYNDLV